MVLLFCPGRGWVGSGGMGGGGGGGGGAERSRCAGSVRRRREAHIYFHPLRQTGGLKTSRECAVYTRGFAPQLREEVGTHGYLLHCADQSMPSRSGPVIDASLPQLLNTAHSLLSTFSDFEELFMSIARAHLDTLSKVNMVLNVHRNRTAYSRTGRRGYGGGGRGTLYTYRYIVTTRMTPALRWAAMRAILMFQ